MGASFEAYCMGVLMAASDLGSILFWYSNFWIRRQYTSFSRPLLPFDTISIDTTLRFPDIINFGTSHRDHRSERWMPGDVMLKG